MANNIPLKPENERFTDRQWQSIFDGGDNLLVAASAGSGKTAVLVRRVIEKIKKGANISDLLVVTYTEAAASEMKERVQQALESAVNTEPDPALQQHFAKQLTGLATANISTLHAFCLRVVQRFYYLIDLDPHFRMLTDDTETLLLKEEVWEVLRDDYYEKDQELFYQLTANFSSDRSDDGLTELIFSLYEFARVNPDPKKWLAELLIPYQAENLADSELFQGIVEPVITTKLAETILALKEAASLAEGETEFEKTFALLQNELAQAENLQEIWLSRNLDNFYQSLQGAEFKRFYAPTTADPEAKDQIQILRNLAKKAIVDIKETYFPQAPAEQIALLKRCQPLIEKLVAVGQDFIAAYSQRKRKEGLLDFNDLEHFALEILTTESVNGTREAQQHYRQLFTEVLVDEYQDVNRLQEAILSLLYHSEEEHGNLFMVGDVKQSIYSFRLADPTLFIEKYEAYGENSGGRRIILAENFRSRKEVLDFTNLIFAQLMDQSVGQITYDEDAALVNGFKDFPDSPDFTPELLIFENEKDKIETESELIEDKTDGELYMTALKIRELLDQKFQIYDKKAEEMRTIRPKDIVLLTPTKKNNLEILEIFKELQIPLEINDTQNYFQATEIQTMLSLLQIIDNPYQDIPLVAVLRSPIVGLSEPELAKIRLADTENTFYDAVKKYLAKDDALAQKLMDFLQDLATWRQTARQEAIATLLWEIYDKTAYLDYIIGLPAGKQRHANLIALVERAKVYENSSFRGLYQFLRFIEKMRAKDKDLAEPLSDSQEDAVRVMTIHASKGLEFPVVFLLDMSKKANTSDLTVSYIFDEKAGIGIKFLDPLTRFESVSMPFQAIKQVKLQKQLSEEMRKLYVALTRGEQKLFLVGSYKDQADTLKNWQKDAANPNLVLTESLRLSSAASFMDWVGLALFRHPKMSTYQQEISTEKIPYLEKAPGDFVITWTNLETLMEKSAQLSRKAPQETSHDTVIASDAASLKKRLDFEYPFETATKTTSYQSVSEIKRIFEDPDTKSGGQIYLDANNTATQQIFRYTEEELAQPRFLRQGKTVTPADVGTATHTILQLLPLDQMPTKASVEKLVAELVKKRLLQGEVAEKIAIDQILDFFKTPLGQELLAQHTHVQREAPFAMLLPADTIFADYPAKDEVLIHGIVDGYIEYPDHLVLYDFKTDYVAKADSEKIVKRYLGQLRLYNQALQEALKKPVKQTYLVLLNSGQVLEVTDKLIPVSR